MGHTTGPPHAAASPLPAVAPPLPGGAIPGDCPCPRRGLGLTRNPGPPQPAQDLPGSYSPECGRPERRGKGRGDKIPLVVARPRARAACLQLGGGPLGRVTPIQQKRMKRVRGQRGRQPWAEPLLLCAAPSQTQERARLRARPHPEPRPLPAPGASAGAPGGGPLPAADWGPAPGPGRPPRTGRSEAAAFGHCTAVPVLGCSSREESYPSLASQPSSRAKRRRGGRQLHRGGGQGQQRHAPGHVPRPPKVPRKGGGASRAPSARQRGGSSGWAAGRSREEAACPGDEDGGGEEGGGGSREEASLRPAETNAAPSCGGQATALHGPAPRPGAVGKP